MTDKEIADMVSESLDRQNLLDLRAVLSTQEGRRFFCWLIEKCGQNRTSFTGNSETYLKEGQRNIALLLMNRCKNLKLEGLKLMQKAEEEYLILQIQTEQNVRQKLKGGS